ncbi:MAG: EamA family transporter [Albidovulum sp.]
MSALPWVLATLIASAAQTGRNAAQASLTRTIGTVGATQVRFLFGLPFAILFLALVRLVSGEAIPTITPRAIGFITLGALAQIAATALMLRVMQSRSFAMTTAWINTEPVILAIGAAVVLRDPLSPAALLAIAIATLGVVVMSFKPGAALHLREAGPAINGLLAAGFFGAAAIGFRGGIIAFPDGGFVIRASTALVLGLTIQSSLLLLWMIAFDRAAIRASLGVWRTSLGAGFLGAFASQFWFIGFALTSAANVRTWALVEVVMAQAVSRFIFRQPVSARQMAGMALIILGVGLLLNAQP